MPSGLMVNRSRFRTLMRGFRLLNFGDLFAKQTQAFGETGGFQDFLATSGIPQEAAGHEVHQGVMVFQVTEKLFHFTQACLSGDFHFLQMFVNLRHESIPDHGVRWGLGLEVLDRFGRGDDIRTYLHQMVEPDPGDSLENQVGGAVRLCHTGSNQAQPSHRRGGLTGLLHSHRKHPRAFQGLGQHLPVAGFKNSQRKKMVREKDRLRQDHYPNLFR